MNRILVSGCCGFIGSHLCELLLKKGLIICGIDNMNDYYDINIKEKNLQLLNKYKNFSFYKDDIVNTNIISLFKPYKIVHLASMAGVRYSIKNPKYYCKVNIEGFIHILEESVKNNVKQIVYASSSSVYGLNSKLPFNEEDITDTCNSPYACSKLATELYAKMYNQLYGIKTIGLRFFTVYGPRGRPDMAPYKFLYSIMNNKPITKYGNGLSTRDYTYIDDIVNGINLSLENKKNIECDVLNLGSSNPISLNKFIETCEKITNKSAIIEEYNNQLGDVPHTYADITKAEKLLNYKPTTSLKEGLKNTYNYLLTNK